MSDKPRIEKNSDCFFVTPIGENGSTIRRRADGLTKVLAPVVKEFGLKIVAAHHINQPGSISKQIIERLISNRLVIVDLTGANGNVMYELAIRHSTGLPTVAICENGANLPFDVYNERVIQYDYDILGAQELLSKIRGAIKEALESGTTDNPIFSFVQYSGILSKIKPDDPFGLVLKKLSDLEGRINHEFRGSIFQEKLKTPYTIVVELPNSSLTQTKEVHKQIQDDFTCAVSSRYILFNPDQCSYILLTGIAEINLPAVNATIAELLNLQQIPFSLRTFFNDLDDKSWRIN